MREQIRQGHFFAYIREGKFTAILFVCFCLIFTGVFWLYNLEIEAIWYAAALCLILTIILLPIRFKRYCKRANERRNLIRNIELSYADLPVPSSLVERDYQEMVQILREINRQHLTEWENSKQESMDYYTTWVHQIKTPIAVMQMMLQMEDTKEHRDLSAELFRIEQYVEMVLSYLRLGSGSNDLVIKQCTLDDIIKQAIHKYAPYFIRKRIRLSYEPTDQTILTDEKWLLLIVEQLLSNAIKYTKHGEIRITVTEDMVLQIADTGIGIAPEDMPRIFEKGFTGYNGRSYKKATGLGLYLCKQAAEKLGITIGAESVVGKGTTFSLDLKQQKLEVE